MVEATREGYGTRLEPGYTTELLDAYGGIATVAVLSSAYMDYLHIARFRSSGCRHRAMRSASPASHDSM